MLTTKEYSILRLLSEGFTYNEVCFRLKITGSCLHAHTNNIRRKTGIKDTKSKSECERYLMAAPRTPRHGPTSAQTTVLRMILQGMTYKAIAKELKLSVGTVMNSASQGRKRIPGLPEAHHTETSIREYLSTRENGQPFSLDPML